MKNEPVLKRFFDKLIPDEITGCWEWVAANSGKDGYGVFVLSGKNKMKAHRASWILFKGEIPDGIQVLHRCDNPPCVNPDHLFLGTQNDNIQDMKIKGRCRGVTGEMHPNAKLTEKDVMDIRALSGDGVSRKTLCAMFGIKKSMMSNICRGASWRHIP